MQIMMMWHDLGAGESNHAINNRSRCRHVLTSEETVISFGLSGGPIYIKSLSSEFHFCICRFSATEGSAEILSLY